MTQTPQCWYDYYSDVSRVHHWLWPGPPRWPPSLPKLGGVCLFLEVPVTLVPVTRREEPGKSRHQPWTNTERASTCLHTLPLGRSPTVGVGSVPSLKWRVPDRHP